MGEPLLRVRGLVKRFGGLRASDGVDLDLARGEIHALIGPNGAGKTTLVHQLSGALRPDAGRIDFGGVDVTRRPMHVRVRCGIARSFQVTNVFPRLTALENVALAAQARGGSSFSFWRARSRDCAIFGQARATLDRVGLGARAGIRASALAHGEQRALEIALALATGAALLLLDEPLAGMGPGESASMVALVASLRGETTVLLVEHDMDAVFQLADRISVMVRGRVLATGTVAEIRAHPEVRAAYLGEDGPR
ncbi:MAG TPA: ABC transporter ATP-binding protein [Usitatibacter sp.]|nr:ABC transporter ATP-binding protein [Usitatibacter sp.]